MNNQLALLISGIENCYESFKYWIYLLHQVEKFNTTRWIFFHNLSKKPTLEQVSLKFRKEWVWLDSISYFDIYKCPKTQSIWVQYTQGWGSPARFVNNDEDIYDVVSEMECYQY